MSIDGKINCPACGSSNSGITALTRSIECAQCGQWIHFNNNIWSSTGRFEHEIDAPGFLRTGRAGLLQQVRFHVAGRVRLGYKRGHWDEWWLAFEDGTGCWIEEDDGNYLLHTEVSLNDTQTDDAKNSGALNTAAALEFRVDTEALQATHVGQFIDAGNERWFVTETGNATVLGAEGQLPVSVSPGLTMRYLDAVTGGRELAIELWPEGALASISTLLDATTLRWDS